MAAVTRSCAPLGRSILQGVVQVVPGLVLNGGRRRRHEQGVWQVVHRDQGVLRKDLRPLQHVGQLAHVARPVVARQRL